MSSNTPVSPVAQARPDVVSVETTARPTPAPVRVRFSEVLARGAGSFVRGAQVAMGALPGGPLMALAIRGGGSVPALPGVGGPGAPNLLPEGPGVAALGAGAVGVGGAAMPGAGGEGGGVEASIAQAQEMNLYYLDVQMRMDSQNRSFTTLSNVLKAEHDTMKNAIGNLR
jgi:hypothetical protein